ncbi:MAG: deoxyribose-phosphate aldolase [Halobacteriales archaeon]|nr:deoxyribose-phosphate aldolase [Halobacteriales archaeon]
MDRPDLAARIDHTVLGPETTIVDVKRTLDAAIEHGMNACVPPCYVDRATEYTPGVSIVTVIGFPHGQHATATKRAEAVTAWEDGVDEIDMVLNVGRLKADELDAVQTDIEEVVASVPIPVKVIIETALLSDDEKHTACALAADAGARFVKTSTGFASGGATVEDVELMAAYLPVKASGGIGSWDRARELLVAGADRIGASRGDVIIEEFRRTNE